MEDKKITETEKIDSDFSDFTDVEVQPKEETKIEQAPVVEEKTEPDIVLYKNEEVVDKTAFVPAPEVTNEYLKIAEAARTKFFAEYKKKNSIKSILSIGILAIMLIGWILPSTLIPEGNGGLLISIVICALCIAGLAIYSSFFRKKADAGLKEYFATYYEQSYKYAFSGTEASNFVGALDNKLDEEFFKKNKLFKDVVKVGSRYFSTFTYKGLNCTVCDAAAQTKGAKSLQTLFVGKYLTAENSYKGDGLYIYIKGNKRALPPNNIKSYPLIEDNKDFAIFGEEKEKKAISASVRTAIHKIKTNKTLVDVSISLQKGTTHICLGYEDDLMVIPLQNKMDPRPYDQFKADIELFLEIAEIFNKKKGEE